MADTKITALTALTAADPANDVIPIVDVSDTTMAASGTTKKISVNNILGASGTATLASATITGDLTVRTNKLAVTSTGVGCGTPTPNFQLHVAGTDTTNVLFAGVTKGIRFVQSASTSSITGVDNTGAASYQPLSIGGSALDFSLSGSTAMTLNSTGLGVGVSPNDKLTVLADNYLSFQTSTLTFNSGRVGRIGAVSTGSGNGYLVFETYKGGSGGGERMRIDSDGNVGVGVTPSLWSGYKAIGLSNQGCHLYALNASSTSGLTSNAYNNGTNWIYINSQASGRYEMVGAAHSWYTAPSGTAGNPISGANAFTQAMTLDASGNLLVGTTNTSATAGPGFKAQYSSTVPQFAIVTNEAGSSTALSLYNVNAATYRFYVNNAGTVFATTTAISPITSDERLKQNIVDYDKGLEEVLALRPRHFEYKAEPNRKLAGFISQEVKTVIPDAIRPTLQDPEMMTYEIDWYPLLVKAIQELTARVQTLEAR